ncbi:MAG: DUF192 domain-containing protein [Dongiaceae bacterium]
MRFSPICVVLFAFLALGPAPASADSDLLVIDTAGGPRNFRVEVAVTPAQRQQGLMYRESLAADAGMLFLYGEDRQVRMWMKNTLIPLDMIFIRRDGTVESVAERTIPLSSAIVASKGDVAAVLEVNGGTAARLGIRPGDRVRHAAFGNSG